MRRRESVRLVTRGGEGGLIAKRKNNAGVRVTRVW